MKLNLIFIFVLSSFFCLAQSGIDGNLPASPEVSLFTRSGEFAVNHYTGSLNVSFPLFTLKENGFELPIVLSYGGNGVRVTDNSTWVGLDWNLMPGGCITRIPMGTYHDYQGDVQNLHPKLIENLEDQQQRCLWNSDYYNSYGLWTGTDIYQALSEQHFSVFKPMPGVSNTLPDIIGGNLFQPDIFVMNFLDYSLKFFINPLTSDIVFFEKDRPVEITPVGDISSWNVVLEDGTKLTFDVMEVTVLGVNGHGEYNESHTWKLSNIELPTGEEIDFNYVNKIYNQYQLEDAYSKHFESSYDYNLNMLLFHNSNPFPSVPDVSYYRTNEVQYRTKYLSSISSPHYLIEFQLTPSVEKPRLEKVLISNKLSTINKKCFSFEYERFTHCGNGWNYYNTTPLGTEETYAKYKLKSLRESVIKNSIESFLPKTNFEYIENIGLPSVLSRSQDYWGYFNGVSNSNLFVNECRMFAVYPYPIYSDLDDDPHNYISIVKSACTANRTVDSTYACQGLLKKIIYPTGGYSTFSFEQHKFGSDDFPHIMTRAEYYNPSLYTGHPYGSSTGAGFRISEIKNYDGNSNFVGRKKISYDTGTYQQPLGFWVVSRGGTCSGFYTGIRVSPSLHSLPYIFNNVGYQFVEEMNYDTETGIPSTPPQGKTYYRFHCASMEYSGEVFPKVPGLSNPLNGKIKEIQSFDKNDNRVYEKRYQYAPVKLSQFTCIKANYRFYHTGCDVMERDNVYELTYYPLESYSCKLTDVWEDYTNGLTLISKHNGNVYWQDDYGLLKESNQQNSQNTFNTTTFKYTGNLSYGVYEQMKTSKHMLNVPIEQINKANGLVVGGNLTTYKLVNSRFLPDKQYSFETNTPLSSYTEFNGLTKDSHYGSTAETEFIDYNTGGRLTKAKSKDGLYSYYVWGYNNLFPVAKIVSSTNTTISATINDSNLSKSDNLTSIVNDVSYLKTALSSYLNNPIYQVTLYTYAPIFGMTSQTDPKGVTTYYEYDNFGRLSGVRNDDSKVLKKYDYHYKQ